MTFTYALSDLTSADTTTKNRALVRLRIGDTDSDAQLLQDEEIAAVLAVTTAIPVAALQCCRLVLARLARDIDASGAGMNVSRSQKTQHYRDLISELEDEIRLGAQAYLGGTSIARETAIEADTDFKRPAFRRAMHDDRRGSRSAAEEDDR